MPWHEGEPPKDGKEYVVESITYKGPLIVSWYTHNGFAAFWDWDQDIDDRIVRWHDLA